MNIFEQAARKGLRFDSPIGLLTTEQIWNLPLKARGEQADLDKLARKVHLELKGLEEVSFVDDNPDPAKASLELRLEILKYVIEAKKEAAAAVAKAFENADRKRRLLRALADKDEAILAGMSREEIEAEIAKVDA